MPETKTKINPQADSLITHARVLRTVDELLDVAERLRELRDELDAAYEKEGSK